MELKSRIDILKEDLNSANVQLVENQINQKVLEKRTLIIKPGKEYEQLQAALTQKKQNIERIEEVINVIEEMIKEEEKNG
jgi:hypothetical protein